MTILNVPYIEAQPNNCGIACIAMLVAYKTNVFLKVNKLAYKYKNSDNYIDNIGWKHDSLISILNKFGLHAYRAGEQSFLQIIESVKQNNPVIVSLIVPKVNNLSIKGIYIPKNKLLSSTGHLCVIVGINNSDLMLHDPRNIGKYKNNLKITFKEFQRVFTGRCIYLK
ncbi:MAG: hypothetical protein UR39_C0002G0163 [Candidatus Woesebacteria bacterium GW2011_GWA1_33_30]|uniref:Peptidase C39 domain-containing protein n=1 Tax=Candidatus Woesebacteria bacterium GW2011_GWA2_33_28 TaxID=1618561 RepID=A0A0G0CA41_9BACT|nr:MAG: hypothetical protein UR38_C0002G0163 [Candidatus Woesebacteria bacterium GW2011_GWA2_33_28]KKP48873.1 MAG: hypothetical protein UR39_C0002G0163 [Candidatus Woesebacteria bacterium GW2011_GWA1_33_30]KKP50146.1 MAG: hypothetical protein UR40_C0002G0163 [Microgenomates group bacterium GW2011_GWC1_33_32]KKP51916.1 MAG: hypothetical protein UR44_C0006G0162 [Candidatus Woesebacteria bacterium GW2011_GWB1_33_38]